MAAEQTERQMLNPLSSDGKQLLSDIVTRYQEFNVLQTTEHAGDVLDLLDSKFYDVLHSCDTSHLSLLKAYLEGKLLEGPQKHNALNFVNAQNILSYYEKLKTVENQRKCLEICASLLLETSNPLQDIAQNGEIQLPKPVSLGPRPSSALNRRPSSRCSMLSSRGSARSQKAEDHSALVDVYETTYERQFPRPATVMGITRPRSVRPSAEAELSELRKHFVTSYSRDFHEKEQTRSEPIRSGSGSGQRRNNPHPLNSFMVYQLPRSQPLGLEMPPALGFDDKTVESAIKSKTTTTYFNNYLGVPPGVNLASAFAERVPDMRPISRAKTCYETTTARVFTHPKSQEDLKNASVTRFGSNFNLSKVAESIVPTANSRLIRPGRGGRVTTYDSEFIKRDIPNIRPTRRPPIQESYEGALNVPIHLTEKPFIINREEIKNKVQEQMQRLETA